MAQPTITYHDELTVLTDADLARLGRMLVMSIPAAHALGHSMPASSYMYYGGDDLLTELFADYLAANAHVPIREASDRLTTFSKRFRLDHFGAESAGTLTQRTENP